MRTEAPLLPTAATFLFHLDAAVVQVSTHVLVVGAGGNTRHMAVIRV